MEDTATESTASLGEVPLAFLAFGFGVFGEEALNWQGRAEA